MNDHTHTAVQAALTVGRQGMDLLSYATVAAWIMGVVPPIATVLSFVWLCIQIYSFFEKRRNTHRIRRRKSDYV